MIPTNIRAQTTFIIRPLPPIASHPLESTPGTMCSVVSCLSRGGAQHLRPLLSPLLAALAAKKEQRASPAHFFFVRPPRLAAVSTWRATPVASRQPPAALVQKKSQIGTKLIFVVDRPAPMSTRAKEEKRVDFAARRIERHKALPAMTLICPAHK